jgi:uncharacterized membrane protein
MRILLRVIQILCILPATVSVPFVAAVVPAAIFDLSQHTYGLAEVSLAIALSACILLGTASSWAFILLWPERLRATNLKRPVQTGLGLGVLAGCGVLIWAAKFIVNDSSTSDHWGAILSWVLFCGPPIAVVAYQLIQTLKYQRPITSGSGRDYLRVRP